MHAETGTIAERQEDLAPLYQKYLTFITPTLAENRPEDEKPTLPKTYEAFCDWWQTLAPEKQDQCRHDYEIGRKQTLKDAKRHVHELLKQARKRAGGTLKK